MISYSIAIRTLGKAGKKYQKLLNSITKLNVQPEKIIVVLPEGYKPPVEKIGTECFVYSKKGMIPQRLFALQYITSEYTLFCDDDVELSADFIEKLAETTGLTTGELDRHFTTLLAEKGEKKKRNRKYGAICARAKAMGIMQGDAIGAIMDIDSADQRFNLRLDEFLEADDFNFAHDFIGIQENIVRGRFPATDFGYFVPRFAGRSE